MPHKDTEARKKYAQEWKQQRYAEARTILCACGCQRQLKEFTPSGRNRRFLFGHKTPRTGPPPRVVNAKIILCGCGCGRTLQDRNTHGNKQSYIYGHGSGRKYDPADLPQSKALSTSKAAIRSRESRWSRKVAVLKHYGGSPPKCACCGESHVQFLAIDHVHRNGAQQRRELGNNGGNVFYAWLVKRGFPDGYRVLCHNCNMAIGIWGKCPHEPDSRCRVPG